MKKFIALVLSLIMTFAVASPAYAISNGYAFVETSVLANCDVQEKMEDILCAVEPQKALFGLSDINFENVQLGEEIPVYETYNNSLVPSELHIVPILLDGEVISLFYIMQSENEWIVQLGKGLVSKIKAQANELQSIDFRYYTQCTLKDYIAEHKPDIVICVRDETTFLSEAGNGITE